MRRFIEEDEFGGTIEWCTCNCPERAHYYKHYPATFTCPEDCEYGCRNCKDCPNEDNKWCENCGEWVDGDKIAKAEDGVSDYCDKCREEEYK